MSMMSSILYPCLPSKMTNVRFFFFTLFQILPPVICSLISSLTGTGVVTSVPSDSPDDYAALRDLQNKAVSCLD